MVGWGLLYLEVVLEWDKSISISIHMIHLGRATVGQKIFMCFALQCAMVQIARDCYTWREKWCAVPELGKEKEALCDIKQ